MYIAILTIYMYMYNGTCTCMFTCTLGQSTCVQCTCTLDMDMWTTSRHVWKSKYVILLWAKLAKDFSPKFNDCTCTCTCNLHVQSFSCSNDLHMYSVIIMVLYVRLYTMKSVYTAHLPRRQRERRLQGHQPLEISHLNQQPCPSP